MTDELGITQLPTGDNPALQIQVSQHLAVNAASEKQDAAALFINFFVTTPEAGAELGTNRGIPSSPVVREAIAGDASPIDAMLYDYLNAAEGRTIPQGPNLPNDQEFVDTLKQIGQSIAFGQTTREDGAQQIFDLINRLMVK
jgi:multiple sugar transport system substrate-binding protein